MADTKISGLTALAAADVETDADTLAIVDDSATATKKITVDNLRTAMGPKLDTVQATTSGTEKDFTIPAWAKKVTVMFAGVSFDGTNSPLIQLGDSGGIEATGYSGSSSNGTDEALSTGFTVTPAGSASSTIHGSVALTLMNSSTNTWTAMGVVGRSDSAQMGWVGGSKALSGTLTTVRVTSEGTPDDFDAGSVNVLIE